MRSFNVLWAVVIGTLFVVNFVMLNAAVTPELMHGVVVTNVQLAIGAIAALVLLRGPKKN